MGTGREVDAIGWALNVRVLDPIRNPGQFLHMLSRTESAGLPVHLHDMGVLFPENFWTPNLGAQHRQTWMAFMYRVYFTRKDCGRQNIGACSNWGGLLAI